MTELTASHIEQLVAATSPDALFLLADRTVADRHPWAIALLEQSIPSPLHIVYVAGDERIKELTQIAAVADQLNRHCASRRSLLLALGGGALLDFAGFLAAIYKRGIEVAYIPTTLLAMVDAAYGGKTAVNLGGVKNLLGVIREPSEVLLSERFLTSLPPSALVSGYGELLKYGLLEGDPLWSQLLGQDPLGAAHALMPFIRLAAEIKARYVRQDLYDNGVRRHLNLGHTLGHALESHSYRSDSPRALEHGEAVILGMIGELYLAHCRLGFPPRELHRLEQFARQYLRPYSFDCSDYEDLLALIRQDKKNLRDDIRIIGLSQPGTVEEITVTAEELREGLDYLRDALGL